MLEVQRKKRIESEKIRKEEQRILIPLIHNSRTEELVEDLCIKLSKLKGLINV
jgi:hypothetical protein